MSEICAINGMIDTFAPDNWPYCPAQYAAPSTLQFCKVFHKYPKQLLPQLVHMMYVSTSLVISEYNITQFRIQEKQKECVVTSKKFGEPPPIPPPATPVSS